MFRAKWLAPAALLVPGVAFAHPGHLETLGYWAGFQHALFGVDHLLVTAGVGLLTAKLQSRRAWLLPAAFVVFGMLGGVLGMQHGAIPGLSLWVASSVIAIGAVLMTARQSLPLLTVLVAGIAVLHGHAHAAQTIGMHDALAFDAGLLHSTVTLLLAGVFAGRALQARPEGKHAWAAVGGVIATIGSWLVYAVS
jgi:urease accessory protein